MAGLRARTEHGTSRRAGGVRTTRRPYSSLPSCASLQLVSATSAFSSTRPASETTGVLGSFLEQYYSRAASIPRSLLVPAMPDDAVALEAFLTDRRGGPVHLRVPQRGEKRELMALAVRAANCCRDIAASRSAG